MSDETLLKGIFADGELAAEATIRNFRIVRIEGRREFSRTVEHYNLDLNRRRIETETQREREEDLRRLEEFAKETKRSKNHD